MHIYVHTVVLMLDGTFEVYQNSLNSAEFLQKILEEL